MDYKNLGSLGAYLHKSSRFTGIQKFLKENFGKASYATKKGVTYITDPRIEMISGTTLLLGGGAFTFVNMFDSLLETGLLKDYIFNLYASFGIIIVGVATGAHGALREGKRRGVNLD